MFVLLGQSDHLGWKIHDRDDNHSILSSDVNHILKTFLVELHENKETAEDMHFVGLDLRKRFDEAHLKGPRFLVGDGEPVQATSFVLDLVHNNLKRVVFYSGESSPFQSLSRTNRCFVHKAHSKA